MFSSFSKSIFKKIYQTYESYKSDDMISLNPVIKNELEEVLSATDGGVVYQSDWESFALLFPYGNVLAINPWFFRGQPIGNITYEEEILSMCVTYFEYSKYKRLEMITNKAIDSLLPHCYDYADMILTSPLKVTCTKPINCVFKSLKAVPEASLKELFHLTFEKGDARFYGLLEPNEKKYFWTHLDYKEAFEDPCSMALYSEDQLLAFALTLNLEEDTKHITCMCIHPNYQGQGIGSFILSEIIQRAGGMQISLGTETQMKAFQLYKKFGFEVTDTKYHYVLKKER